MHRPRQAEVDRRLISMGTRVAVAAAILLCAATGACSRLAPPKHDAVVPLEGQRLLATVDGGHLDLHLSRPVSLRSGEPLVIFASGDGGWFGAAVGMFKAIADAGYPVIGLSSRAVLQAERRSGRTVSETGLARVYATIIEQSEQAMRLDPSSRVVLSGWSRGASIAVILAAHHMPPQVSGVVAVGLSADEDLNVDLGSDEEGEPGAENLHGTDTYAMLRDIAGRVAVIQSSGDGYLSAERARVLFGADTADRRLYEVKASNHRFSGGEEAFRTAFQGAFDWVTADREQAP